MAAAKARGKCVGRNWIPDGLGGHEQGTEATGEVPEADRLCLRRGTLRMWRTTRNRRHPNGLTVFQAALSDAGDAGDEKRGRFIAHYFWAS